ncbi:hypothetical protein [Candidatus Chlamydia sanziniae]|uniref:Uncharacterized protein n=1 Tax=Candidatus Chlamydia sanziniae TaxID=1806891 RepID=A0A1A9HY69_9CHLA|nr:hypothetical protein [Candidatus Chlamydia sanziniae]ANH78984.1 hypothetical protein Cs308_0814 [Candidatus Chlamydia sanziniae]
MSMPSLFESSTPPTPLLSVLTSEQKLEIYHNVSYHRWKGVLPAILAAIILTFAVIVFSLGAILLGCPPIGVSIMTEIILPLIVPAVLAFILLVLPLNIYAYSHHKHALNLHKNLAESNYNQIRNHCIQEKNISKQPLANFIESNVLVPQASKRFSFISLGKTIKGLPPKDSDQASRYDETILQALEYVKEGIHMNQYEKKKRDKREAEET